MFVFNVISAARIKQTILLLVAIFLTSGCTTIRKPGDPERFWEKFPPPPGRSTGVSSIGFDRCGGLWVMSGTGTYFWNSRDKKWSDSVLSSGQYLTQLYGRAKTDLYATQRGTAEHTADVYRLERGRAIFVTNIYRVAHDSPGFYVSDDGRMFNWGGEKLRVYARDEWIEQAVSFSQSPIVLDGGNTVAMYVKGRLYVVNKYNKFSEIKIDGGANERANRGAVWNKKAAILLEYGAPGVSRIDLRTGDLVDTKSINVVLGKRPLYDLISTPDGSVLILAYDAELSSYVLLKVSPDGTTNLVRATAGLPWENTQFSDHPRSVLLDRHDAVWFASDKVGVFYFQDGLIHEFDARVDNSPRTCNRLMQDRTGNIYAGAGEDGLYVYNNGKSLTGQPLPAPVAISGPIKSEWTHEIPPPNRLELAWPVGELILFTTHNGKKLTALNANDGSVRFTLPVSRADAASTWVSADDDPAKLTVCLADGICSVDAQTGAILKTLKTTRDQRIAPIRVDDDYILVPESRGETITRVSSDGQNVWTYQLPGYVMTHPSASGNVLVVQTRKGSYGGQATSGIDIKTGKKLWADVIDAYGAGTASANDTTYCVETASFLSPQKTEAWIIARNPQIGNRLWHYRKSGTTIDQAPLIDSATRRVYGVIRDGTIVCLDASTGESIWEIKLPSPPADAEAGSYEAYQSCASLFDGMLAVTTQDQVLYLIDAADGTIRRRVALTEDIIKHGNRAGSVRLVAGPWFLGGLLIVPAETEISANNFSSIAEKADDSKRSAK